MKERSKSHVIESAMLHTDGELSPVLCSVLPVRVLRDVRYFIACALLLNVCVDTGCRFVCIV